MTTPPEEPQPPIQPPAQQPGAPINNPFANGVGEGIATIKAGPLSTKLGYAAGVLGILTFIAAFLPWASISIDFSGVSQSESVSGTSDGNDGVLTLLLGLAAGGLGIAYALKGILQKPAAIVAIVAGAIITLISIVDISDISDIGDGFGGLGGVDVSVGIGLWLTLVFGIGFLAVGVLQLIKRDS